jgi:peptidyl-tRNA hydrolase
MPEETINFVLSAFLRPERPVLEQAIKQAVESIELWLEKGISEAMNSYN